MQLKVPNNKGEQTAKTGSRLWVAHVSLGLKPQKMNIAGKDVLRALTEHTLLRKHAQ